MRVLRVSVSLLVVVVICLRRCLFAEGGCVGSAGAWCVLLGIAAASAATAAAAAAAAAATPTAAAATRRGVILM